MANDRLGRGASDAREKASQNAAVDIPFGYDLDESQKSNFSVLSWNVFQVVKKAYETDGKSFPGMKALYKIKSSGIEELLGKTELGAFVQRRELGSLRLEPSGRLVFLNKEGAELFDLTVEALARAVTKAEASKERSTAAADAASWLNKKSEAVANYLEMPFDSLGPAPALPDRRIDGKGVSIIDQLRLQETVGPQLIEEQFKGMFLCSEYAVKVFEDFYGKDYVRRTLCPNGKFPNAWDVKEVGGENLELVASTKRNFRHLTNAVGLELISKPRYLDDVQKFFEEVEARRTPAFVTFYWDSDYNNQVWDANAGRPENLRSYNSHIAVAFGLEKQRSETIHNSISVWNFFETYLGMIEPGFCRFLNIRVEKADGRVIKMNRNGRSMRIIETDGSEREVGGNVEEYALEPGDTIKWQDLLMTDFIDHESRIVGFAEILSRVDWYSMDLMTLKGVSVRRHADYKPVDFLHLEPGVPVTEQIAVELSLDVEGLKYYFAVLDDLGIDLSDVRPVQMLPVFDMDELKRIVDAKGGVGALRQRIRKANAESYEKDNPGKRLVVIEKEKSPWSQIKHLFDEHFRGIYQLTDVEREKVLEAVDASSDAIQLKGDVRFREGDVIYLTDERIAAIVAWIRGMQALEFGKEDYVTIVKKGDSSRRFQRDAFNKETFKLREEYDLSYGKLSSLERGLIRRAFRVSNKHISPKEWTRWRRKRWKSPPAGRRLVFKKEYLQDCVEKILERRRLMQLPEGFVGPEGLEVPKDIREAIAKVFPGRNSGEMIIRNLLYFIYAKEQLGGKTRGFVKGAAGLFGLTNSVGPFQIRPTRVDLRNIRGRLRRFGLPIPKSVEELKSLLDKGTKPSKLRDVTPGLGIPSSSSRHGSEEVKNLVSVIVAGSRVKEHFNEMKRQMKGNKEEWDKYFDQNLAVQLMVAYNRDFSAVKRAVYQNWAYNLAVLAGVDPDVELMDIDRIREEKRWSLKPDAPSFRTPRGDLEKRLRSAVLSTFRKIAEKLIAEGEIKAVRSWEVDIDKIFLTKRAFLKSPLFKEIKAWYKRKTGEDGPSFVFSDEELDRGDAIFSFGRRLLKKDAWNASFRDMEKYMELTREMVGPYKGP